MSISSRFEIHHCRGDILAHFYTNLDNAVPFIFNMSNLRLLIENLKNGGVND